MIYITYAVFFTTFLNTIMVLFVNANLTNQSIILGSIFNGADPDFNNRWFISIGDTVIGASIVNIFTPLVEIVIIYIFILPKRIFDRGFCCCYKKTRTLTINKYVSIWSGPKFEIHFKYSMILNLVFISMIFGPGLPILFPITLVSLMVLYISEKYMLYYVNQEPQHYDEVLNNNILNFMYGVPLLPLCFGYWMLTNQ